MTTRISRCAVCGHRIDVAFDGDGTVGCANVACPMHYCLELTLKQSNALQFLIRAARNYAGWSAAQDKALVNAVRRFDRAFGVKKGGK